MSVTHYKFVETRKRDLTGDVYGKLTVLNLAYKKNRNRMWLCMCECGNTRISETYNLTSGKNKSCSQACYNRTNNPNRRHGLSNTYFQRTLYNMRYRCYNEKCDKYKHYGGRGIKICDRWMGKDGLKNFAEDMGERPSPKHSIDRIDVNGDYSPENCRWATQKEQVRNTRNRKFYLYNGELLTLTEICNLTGKKFYNLYERIEKLDIKSGESISPAL